MPEDIIINPFDTDAFDMASLCAAIEILPNNYGRVNQLGIFGEDGISTRTAVVEEKNGILSLLQTQPVGAPGAQNKTGKRKVRSFVVPHIPLDDVIMPAEFQGVRPFGQGSGLETLAKVMNDHLQTAKNKYNITMEHLKMGALKGIILDADGSQLYDLYAEFGIVAKEIDFALTSSGTDVSAKCRELVRHVEDNLHGEVMNGVRCLVSQEFFDALIAHSKVKEFYVNHSAAMELIKQDPRKGFAFSGVTFEEYRAVASQPDGNPRRFITAGEGHAFPEGTMGTFKTIFAPGEFIETANTRGIPLYVKQALEKMGRWIDLHIESNPLPLCLRPGVLVKVKKNS